MRPSFEQVTSNPFLLPSSVTAVSTMLSLPSLRLTTSCSKPEDLVKTRRDLFGAENDGSERDKPAVAAVIVAVARVRRNSRRLEWRVLCNLVWMSVDSCADIIQPNRPQGSVSAVNWGCSRV